LLFNFVFEYAFSRTQGNQEDWNGTLHILSYAEVKGENIDTMQKNTEALLDASTEVSVEVNPEKTNDMLMSCCQKARQKHCVEIANRYSEDVQIFGNNTDSSKLHARRDEEQTRGMLGGIWFSIFCLSTCCLGM
jgi:hypothetical protein